MNSLLSLRFPGNNPNHHLWDNHGTWWCHYTEHLADFTKRRVRVNLHTNKGISNNRLSRRERAVCPIWVTFRSESYPMRYGELRKVGQAGEEPLLARNCDF